MATAVLDPDAQSGIKSGYFAWSAEDDSAYLITADGALPIDGVRGLTELDDAQLSRMGSDWFTGEGSGFTIAEPGTPATVGNNGFDGQVSGYFVGATKAVFIAGAAGPICYGKRERFTFDGSSIDSRFTASGATNGTRVNSSGNIVSGTAPRIDYLYGTAELLGEGERTNLHLRSAEFDNAAWTKNQCTISANAVTGPDGSSTADKEVEAAVTNFHFVTPAAGVTVTTNPITTSLYVKAAERTRYGIFPYNSGAGSKFNLSTGAVISQDSGVTAAIAAAPQGFYRCAATITAPGTSAGPWLILLNGSNATNYAGDGTSGAHVWGAQLEQASFASSYIPTTTAAVTRTAENIASNDFAWFNQAEGTLFIHFRSPGIGTRTIWQADDGTADCRYCLYTTGTTLKFKIVARGTTVCDLTIGTITAYQQHRCAMTWAVNDVAASLDGAAEATDTDTDTTLPRVDRCRLMASTTAGEELFGRIGKDGVLFDYWPLRRSNVQALAA